MSPPRRPGRPEKPEDEKLDVPVRALVTEPIDDLIERYAEREGHSTKSDFIRYALYQYLLGLASSHPLMIGLELLADDPTFENARKRDL